MAHDHVVRQRIHGACVLEHRAHQPVDGDQPRFVLEAEDTCDVGLLFEQEPVRPAARLQMQRAPHPRQELLRRVEPVPLRGAEEPVLDQRPPAHDLEPAERMDVAEPAAAFLQLGFEQVGRRAVAIATLAGVRGERSRERVGIGTERRQDRIAGLDAESRHRR